MGMRIFVQDDQISDDENECGSENRPVLLTYELICDKNPFDDEIQISWISHNETDTECSLFYFLFLFTLSMVFVL